MSKNKKNESLETDSTEKTVEVHIESEQKTEASSESSASAVDATVAALEAENQSLKDQYLRKLADYENFRKRMFKEKDDAVKYANSKLMADLLTVIDNFERAIQSSDVSKDFASLHDGVEMIRKDLLNMLSNKYGLSRMEALDTEFDPNFHEAIMIEHGECPHPLVVEELVKGYKLYERVLRSAKVKVRMPVNNAASDSPASDEVDTKKDK